MTTLSDLIDQVSLNLHGFGDDQEPRTHLTADITSSSLTLTVNDASSISGGLVEIGDELLWVQSVDSTNGTLTVAPYGRGYGGSTAASHTTGTAVITTPRWPRNAIKRAINQTIAQIYPALFAVKATNLTSVSTTIKYEMPADAADVLSLQWRITGPSKEWMPINRWRFDPSADTGDFPSGKAISIFNGMTPGRSIRVVYITEPTTLTNPTDTLASTGLQASVEDVLVYGASARLIQQYEASRLQMTTVSEAERAQFIQAGAATQASRAMWSLYQLRLDDERSGLLRQYPTPVHYTR